LFEPGQKVSLLNETGGGIVLKVIDRKHVLVRTHEGFENKYQVTELVLVNEEQQKKLTKQFNPAIPKIKHDITGDASRKGKKNPVNLMEIDLHIEELLDNHRNMTNWDIMQVQLKHLRKKIDEAMEKRITKVIIIHGKGEGVLRTEIRNDLLRYSNIEFFDASYQKYGAGATEVRIWYGGNT
jgi:dsDNA-specific endonuclease/ATPase MutS2